MRLPFEYEQLTIGEYGGTTPTTTDFEHARVVILPIPLDRTTSYVPGTRNGPHEILVASSHMELWDEETQTDVHSIGIFTLPEMEFPFASMDEVVGEIRRVTSELIKRDKFPLVLGGEHSITPAVVGAVAAKYPGLSVLQIDAHADLRESVHGDAAQPCVRDAPHARVRADDAGGHPQPVARGSGGGADAFDRDLLRLQHARRRRLDRSCGRLADRARLHHDRRRRVRSGDHAGNRHAGAGRAVVVRGAEAAAPRRSNGARWSAAMSSSCRRCRDTSRRTSSARS